MKHAMKQPARSMRLPPRSAEPGARSAAIDHLTTGAADRLDATASYVEDYELRDAFKGLRQFGRRHLTASLVVAAAIGFLAGTALTARRTRG